MNGPRIPRPDELVRRPELASIVSFIVQLEIGRRILRTSQPHLWNSSSTDFTDLERRTRGIELRAFNLLIELEYFLRDLYDELDSEFDLDLP